jgi:hypothetical protein
MTYLETGDPDPRLTGYYPKWLDNLADDVTLEGSAMDGFVQGAEAVRTVPVQIRALYDYQEFHFAAPLAITAGSRSTPPGSAASRSATSPW